MDQENHPETTGDSASSGEEGAPGVHIPEIEVLEGETLGPGEEPPKKDRWEGLVGPDGLLTKEAFRDLFFKAHELPGQLLQLQTLINARQFPVSQEAADAIHDICVETPALHWMLRPSSVWFQRLAAIGMWAGTMYLGVRLELAARAENAHPDPKASADTDAPDDVSDDYARAQAAQGNA